MTRTRRRCHDGSGIEAPNLTPARGLRLRYLDGCQSYTLVDSNGTYWPMVVLTTANTLRAEASYGGKTGGL